MPYPVRNLPRELDHMNPAAHHAQLGSTMADVIAAINDLRTVYLAFLAHADAGALGTANVATYSPTLPALVALGSRTPVV